MAPKTPSEGFSDKPDREVAVRAGRQHGVVSFDQLFAAGLSRKGIEVRVRRGQYTRVFEGVYAVGADRLTAEGRWMAGVLAGGDGAVLSHESAGGLWEISYLLISPVHVITPTHRRPRPGFKPHRSITLRPEDITAWRGIPVTTPERTIRDLPRHLRDTARIKAKILRLLERRFLAHCEDLGLPAPLVNHPVEGRERDFVWPLDRLVVEIDGPHHDDPAQRAIDRARDRELAVAGWRVLRGAHHELRRTAYDALRSISSIR